MNYLEESFAASTSLTNKAALLWTMAHVKLENLMNETFWGTLQMFMNSTTKDTRYNGITSNCVAYSVDLWNIMKENPHYDPRILKLVAAPGKLFVSMTQTEVIDLPDATTLPLDQQQQPYSPSPAN